MEEKSPFQAAPDVCIGEVQLGCKNKPQLLKKRRKLSSVTQALPCCNCGTAKRVLGAVCNLNPQSIKATLSKLVSLKVVLQPGRPTCPQFTVKQNGLQHYHGHYKKSKRSNKTEPKKSQEANFSIQAMDV